MNDAVKILSDVCIALELVYWSEVKDERPPLPIFRESIKRVRARLFDIQKQRGVIE